MKTIHRDEIGEICSKKNSKIPLWTCFLRKSFHICTGRYTWQGVRWNFPILSGAAGSGGWYKSTSCFSWTSGRAVGVGRLAGGLNRCVLISTPTYLWRWSKSILAYLSQRVGKHPPTWKISVHPSRLFFLHENLGCQIFGWVGWVDCLVKSEVLVRSCHPERWMDWNSFSKFRGWG